MRHERGAWFRESCSWLIRMSAPPKPVDPPLPAEPNSISIPQPVLASRSHKMVRGTLYNLVVQTILFPTGFVVAASLSRRLGPADYGSLAVVSSLMLWIETVLPSIFGPAIVSLVAERATWQRAAAGVARFQLAAAVAVCGLVIACAPAAAAAMGEPELTGYLRLFALDIPISQLYFVNAAVLNGLESYGRSAIAGVSYHVGRMTFVLVILAFRPSIWSAIVAFLCAGVVRALLSRVFIRVRLFGVGGLPLRQILSYSGAGISLALIVPLFDQVGLYFVKVLDADRATAGFYSAAGNIAIVPTVFALAVSSVMLTSITKEFRSGQFEAARVLVRQCSRMVLLLIPFAGLTAACSLEIIRLIYGQSFAPAAPLFVILSFATAVWAVVIISYAPLMAAGKLRWLPFLYAPLLPMLVTAGYLMTTRWGGAGAAMATLCTGVVGSAVASGMVHRVYGKLLPLRTIGSTALITAGLLAAGHLWHAPGLAAIPKMGTLGLGTIGLLFLFGNISRSDVEFLRSLIPLPHQDSKAALQ
jgi:O-antigen/teichoic acid export membrane protein